MLVIDSFNAYAFRMVDEKDNSKRMPKAIWYFILAVMLLYLLVQILPKELVKSWFDSVSGWVQIPVLILLCGYVLFEIIHYFMILAKSTTQEDEEG